MQNPNKLSLFLAIEGYKNGDLTEDLMRKSVDAYSKAIAEESKEPDEANFNFFGVLIGITFTLIALEFLRLMFPDFFNWFVTH